MDEYTINELHRLREENARLRTLLARHGIPADEPKPETPALPQLSLEEKVALFRSLFRGREDVFARRWVSPTTGKSGYQPVCSREWNREYCDKKKYKCAECPNREFQPLGYHDIYRHLEGKDPNGRDVVGVYAIWKDNTCHFLCCDFDDKSCEHGYQDDVRAYVSVCRDWNIPAYIERSRSGNGAHVWILFSEPIQARQARRLGNAILTEAMEREKGKPPTLQIPYPIEVLEYNQCPSAYFYTVKSLDYVYNPGRRVAESNRHYRVDCRSDSGTQR